MRPFQQRSRFRKSALGLKSLLLVAALAVGQARAGGGISFIVNDQSQEERLTLYELRDVYLKERQISQSGQHFIVLDQMDGSVTHDLLLKAVVQKSVADWEGYWLRRKHVLGDQAPQQLPSDALIIRMVQSMNGAIGYVRTSSLTPKILKEHHLKVLATIEEN